jgi:peroxiredoxin
MRTPTLRLPIRWSLSDQPGRGRTKKSIMPQFCFVSVPKARPRQGYLAMLLAWFTLSTGLVPIHAGEVPASDTRAAQPGHSLHADAFNEGPRQAAYLMPGMGNLHWEISTKNPMAQRFFDQGIVQLHGFWYFEAERSFRQAAAFDSQHPIFYWGMARANIENAERSRGFIEQAMSRLEKGNDKEKRLVQAWNERVKKSEENPEKEADKKKDRERLKKYAQDLEQIAYDYPDDIELKAILALQLWQNDGAGESIQSHLAVNSLMSEILRVNPRHPVHHFRIHIWDYRKEALAIDAAAKCGPSAPGIAHMWHMPGHTYTRLHRYADAAWQQEASARVDHAHMARDRVMPDQIHNFAHNNEWLIRNLILLGRVKQAIDLAKNMIELPRHPSYNEIDKRGSARLGRERLLNVLTSYRMWPELATLSNSPYLDPTSHPLIQDEQKSWLAIAELLRGDFDQANHLHSEILEQIAKLKSECVDLREKVRLLEENEQKQQESKSIRPPELLMPYNLSEDLFGDENDPTLLKIPGKELDDSETKDWSTERKDLSKQLRTQAHRHAKLKQFEIAIQAYRAANAGDFEQALRKSNDCRPLVNSIVRMEWLALAGQPDKAMERITRRIEEGPNELIPLACGIWIASKNDLSNEKTLALAKGWMKALSNIASTADDNLELIQRIEPWVETLGQKETWRHQVPAPADIGERPSLDSLGPLRWTPSMAPVWNAMASDGEMRSNKTYAKKPYVMILYLGFGCLHCAEQLKQFSPMVDQYREAGLDVIAVSTESMAQLQSGIKNFGSEMRIPLMVNPELDMFREFRCYDDFEGVPLHGTILVDADGKIRWQDIGFEPFQNATFLLDEAKRLLKL